MEIPWSQSCQSHTDPGRNEIDSKGIQGHGPLGERKFQREENICLVLSPSAAGKCCLNKMFTSWETISNLSWPPAHTRPKKLQVFQTFYIIGFPFAGLNPFPSFRVILNLFWLFWNKRPKNLQYSVIQWLCILSASEFNSQIPLCLALSCNISLQVVFPN